MLRARVPMSRSRVDRRAALEALVRIAAWPRMVVVAAGVAASAGLLLVDVATGDRFRPELPYVLVFVAIAWAGWATDAVLGAVIVTAARLVAVDLPAATSAGGAVLQELLSFGGLALVIGITAWLRDAVLEVEERSRIDTLTGVLNGTAFREQAEIERQRSGREGVPLTLAFIDLDGFKNLNDSVGHQAGDAVLVRFARIVCELTRSYDLVGRMGGDEFVVLFPGTGAAAAYRILERIRRVASSGLPPVRFSAGIATYLDPPESVDAMFHEADGLMYVAKRAGGGRPVGRIVTGERGTLPLGIEIRDGSGERIRPHA